MKCRICGAYNEDYMEYCENCAALLVPDEQNAVKPTVRTGESVGTRTSWGFAKAPEWPSPEFDFSSVSDNDIPPEYIERTAQMTSEDYAEPYAAQSAEPAAGRIPADDPFAASAFADDGAPIKYADPVDDYNFYSYDERATAKGKRAKAAASPSYGGRKQSRGSNKRALIFYGVAGILVIAIIVLAIIFFTGGKDNPDNTVSNDPPAGQVQSGDVPSGVTGDTAVEPSAEPSGDTSESTGKKKQSAVSMFFSSLFGKSPLTKPATIEKDTSTAETAYLITIYAKKKCTVVFTAGTLTSENPTDNGPVKLRVPEQVWIPGEPVEGSTLNITPDVVVIDSDGNRTVVEFDDVITIELPTLNMTLSAPAQTALTTETGTVEITGVVDNNTAEVYANDMQLPVDAEGNFTGVYTLPGVGTQTVNVEARKNGYAIARTTLTVEVAAAAVPEDGAAAVTGDSGTPSFAFDAELERRTTDSSLTVKGTLESGATLEVSGVELNGAVTTDAAAGTFQFTVSMSEVGLYTAVVKSVKNGIEGTRTIYLERSHADKNAYMEDTHALDYQYLLDAPYHDKCYTIYGKVVEIIESDKYHTVARVTTDKGDVIMCYYGSTVTVEANDGKTYSIYCDPYGRYELEGSTVPQVYAWYIKKSG